MGHLSSYSSNSAARIISAWRDQVNAPGLLSSLVGVLLVLVLLCGGATSAGEAPATGLAERLGNKIPLDLTFRDENGKPVRLADLVSGPTVILPVYYSCTNVCAYLQGRMAGTLQALERRPVDDYRVISISFDDQDTAEMAVRSKRTYLTAMRKPFPPDGWRFLTGDASSISRLTDAAGYHVQRSGKDFIHPVASFVIAQDGTIVRYLYGISVLPKDLALALAEAKNGVAGASIRRLVEYCFTYDPAGTTYVFNLLRVSATVVILCTGSFLVFLMVTGRKQKRFNTETQRKSLHKK
jgi:protein SCO1/2